LESRIPFIHFFDGFRTSHEVAKIEQLTEDDLRAMLSDELIQAHRARALSPDHPYCAARLRTRTYISRAAKRSTGFTTRRPAIVEKALNRFGEIVGRKYKLFEYEGAPDAERVIILMGSGAEAAHETVDALVAKGEKVGLLKVRLYRPFSIGHFLAALPATVKTLAVTRSHEGTRGHRRTAVSRCAYGTT